MGKYEDFLKLAANDLKVAKLILNSANDELMQNSAAYNCEQAVEKIMKGLIVNAGGSAGVSRQERNKKFIIIEISRSCKCNFLFFTTNILLFS